MAAGNRDRETRRRELTAKLSALSTEQEERLAQYRAEQYHLPYVDLFGFPLDGNVLALIPREEAAAAGVVLFSKRGQDVRMAAVNPEQAVVDTLNERLREQLGVRPQLYVMSRHSLQVALGRYPAEAAERLVLEADEMIIDEQELAEFEASLGNLTALGARIGSVAPTEIMTAILAGAIGLRASDVHLEPKRDQARLRYRIDGVLQDMAEMDREGWQQVLSRVKVLADLKLNVHDAPQDGSFVLRVGEMRYDVRVSILPGGFGEYIVLRLLSRREEVLTLEELGMKERDQAVVREELKQSTGMILSAGPTGSGKTTTIVACLREVSRPELKIISLEDPIEYRLTGIEQTEVDAEAGYSFAVGLRSILRQDPDIIFVGEMRDQETVETSMHASMTGHLVFSTIHANDAPGVVLRLVHLGMKPNVLAPALNLVIGQRLVRQVCGTCGEEYDPPPALRERIGEVMQGVSHQIFDPQVLGDPTLRLARARGCQACGQTGYQGRVGVFEVFAAHGEVEELILQGADSQRIREAAQRDGMTTIAQDGFLKVLDRVTTVEEVERVSEE